LLGFRENADSGSFQDGIIDLFENQRRLSSVRMTETSGRPEPVKSPVAKALSTLSSSVSLRHFAATFHSHTIFLSHGKNDSNLFVRSPVE